MLVAIACWARWASKARFLASELCRYAEGDTGIRGQAVGAIPLKLPRRDGPGACYLEGEVPRGAEAPCDGYGEPLVTESSGCWIITS